MFLPSKHLLSAFYKTLPSKNPSKNLIFTENPYMRLLRLLLENLLSTLLRSVLLHDPFGVRPIIYFAEIIKVRSVTWWEFRPPTKQIDPPPPHILRTTKVQQLMCKIVWSFLFIIFYSLKKGLILRESPGGINVKRCGKVWKKYDKVPKRFCPLVVAL